MVGSTFLIVRGLFGIVIGVLSFLWPGLTIAVLVGLFAAFAFIDGLTNVIQGLTGSTGHERTWVVVLQGLFGIAAGVMTFLWPGITALVLVMFIASWAIVTGVLEIVAAIRLRREIHGEWLLMLSGVLSIGFGVLVFAYPAAGAVSIAWILGAYAVASGAVLVALGISLRSRRIAVA
jgi:uncharacterized membrane protein HdeD (DUF308 family)